ncbi:solute carrier family 22 member 15 isoform X4 [Phyllopteryx taeniolatus]|uniref:solute carrier family 22 member 15 isoform X4 n=1 Tax=Phyllopteryx taeniolatus TaxID=161469 RepID=UPI002AD4F676|nr:solute carrier family 22 member 15 isoform X4 [Phyllopteryx taeniolatus]
MDVEEAFQVVGEFGAYQKRAVAVLALTQVYMACQSMLVVLVGATPEFHVEKHDGLVSSVTFFGDVDSIVTEWLLVKRQAYKVGLAGSLFFAGLLLGSFVFGPLSDTVGRRPVYLTGGSVLGGAPGLRDGGVSQLRGVRRVAPPGGSDERRHRAGLLHPDAGVRGQVLLGHDRDADQHDVCGGHRPLRSSGFRHPAVEDPGGGGQHLGGPLLLAVRNASGVSSVALLSQPHPAGTGGDAAHGADERPPRPQPDAAPGGRRRLGGLPAAGEPSSPPPQDAAAHVCLVCVQSGVLRPDAGRRRHVRKSLPERGHVRPGRAACLPALHLLYEQTLGRPEEKFVGFLMFGCIGVPLHRLRPGGCRLVAGRDGVGAVGKTDGQRGVQHRLRVHVRAVPHRAQERRSGSLRHVLPSRRNSRSVCSFHVQGCGARHRHPPNVRELQQSRLAAGVGHSHAVHRLLFERPLRRRSGAPAAGDPERTAGPDAGRTTSRPQPSSGEQAAPL